jgi:hypothetical protein
MPWPDTIDVRTLFIRKVSKSNLLSVSSVTSWFVVYCRNANAKSALPAAIVTYCFPLTE